MINSKEERQKGLGGSDIGAVLGINPYKNRLQLYYEKAEGLEFISGNTEAMEWGNILEPVIAERYIQLMGDPLRAVQTIKHPTIPYLFATPDFIVDGKNEGLEIKTVGHNSIKQWGPSGSLEIPEHYYMQICHYMLVLNIPIWHVAALLGGQELRTYTFERDAEIDDAILKGAKLFWEGHVQPRVVPTPDFRDPKTHDILKRRYNLVSDEEVEFSEEVKDIKDQILRKKSLISELKKESDELESKILMAMKNAGVGRFSDGSVYTRSLVKRKEYLVKPIEYVQLRFKGEK